MPKLLITGTYGPEDPTRASLPFHIAKGAREAGFDVGVVLAANSPALLKDAALGSVQGVGMPTLKELFQFAIENQVHVYV